VQGPSDKVHGEAQLRYVMNMSNSTLLLSSRQWAHKTIRCWHQQSCWN